MNGEIQIFNNYFNNEDIEILINTAEVKTNYEKCIIDNKPQTFMVTLTVNLQNTLSNNLLFFKDTNLKTVPMRWVIGDIIEHIDYTKDRSSFDKTVVIYLSDNSNAVFNINQESYLIEKNKAFIFNSNLKHSVSVTDNVPRLLIGPMSENALPVGCSGYGYFNNVTDANIFANALTYNCLNNPTLTPQEAVLIIPSNATFNGWLLAPSIYSSNPTLSNGFPNSQLYIPGLTYYDASYVNFTYALYPSYTIIEPVVNSSQYIMYGGSNSGGNFWYGNSTGFPGFLYKKNLGVGTRRSTQFGAGGNSIATNSYLNNKYKPGLNGIGASSTANRRAKSRLASICSPTESCGKFYNYLGRYNNYTENPNGYFPYPKDPQPPL
jgi:hypothetical protein